MDRGACRSCGQPQPDKPKAAGKQQPARPNGRLFALALWASAEMAEERASQIETAIVAARTFGGLDQEVKKVEQAFAQQRKKVAEPTSALALNRRNKSLAEKRKDAVTEEIETLCAQETDMDQEIIKA